jgi:hypothetical protein
VLPRKWGIYWLAQRLLPSEDGLCFNELQGSDNLYVGYLRSLLRPCVLFGSANNDDCSRNHLQQSAVF